MWSAGSEAQLYVAGHDAWVGASGQRLGSHTSSDRPTLLRVALSHLRDQTKLRKLRVLLSASSCRPFWLDAVSGLKSVDEAQLLAVSQVQAATGLTQPFHVWLDRWKKDQSCLAVATPQEVISQLTSIAGEEGFRLTSIQPAWAQPVNEYVVAWSTSAPTNADAQQSSSSTGKRVLAVAESDAVTLWGMDKGLMAKVQCLTPLPLRMEAAVQRFAMSFGVSGSAVSVVTLAAREPDALTQTGEVSSGGRE